MCWLLHPARRRDDLQREGRGHQNLGKQVIWIERNRRQERIKLFSVKRLTSGRLSDCRRWRGRLRQYVKRKGRIEDQAARQNPCKPNNNVFSDVAFPHGAYYALMAV